MYLFTTCFRFLYYLPSLDPNSICCTIQSGRVHLHILDMVLGVIFSQASDTGHDIK